MGPEGAELLVRVTVDGTDRSAAYQISELEAISISLMASQGEVGIGTVPLPDAAGTYEPYAGQQFKLDVGGTVIIDGFVGAMNRDRNGIVSDTRLVQNHSITDDNALLNGYRAVNWKRPAETDRARILAFNTDFLAHLSLDLTWVLTTNTQTLPAKTYTTEALFSELQDDCGKPTGKELFIERRRLHWHLPTDGLRGGHRHRAARGCRLHQYIHEHEREPADPLEGPDGPRGGRARRQLARAVRLGHRLHGADKA